jgi:hypothetical protein
VKRQRELAGVSVITVHRMLKNSVKVPEYLLATDPVFQALPAELKAFGTSQPEDLEGLGEVTTWCLDLDEIAKFPAPALKPSGWRKFKAWLGMTLRSLPYFLGLKTPCEGFRNLGEVLGPGAAKAPELPAESTKP